MAEGVIRRRDGQAIGGLRLILGQLALHPNHSGGRARLAAFALEAGFLLFGGNRSQGVAATPERLSAQPIRAFLVQLIAFPNSLNSFDPLHRSHNPARTPRFRGTSAMRGREIVPDHPICCQFLAPFLPLRNEREP
ncbi:hypothetical protein [Bradyrhizobium sp. STM 3562]|uniref:hypothetical protein n=1 Tax=Bradyrhizobium sp. STM 3562 TaxID=578924 RepID=UPI00388E8A83